MDGGLIFEGIFPMIQVISFITVAILFVWLSYKRLRSRGSKGNHIQHRDINPIPQKQDAKDTTQSITRYSSRGLKNLGNTCYMNSVLQALNKTYQLTTLIQNLSQQVYIPSQFIVQYKNLMKVLSSKQHIPFQPQKIKQMISKYSAIFQGNGQHDACQFLSTIINYLHQSLNEIKTKVIYKINENIKQDKNLYLEYVKKDSLKMKSIVDDILIGRLKISYRCCVCGQTTTIFQKFNILYLPVGQNYNLYKCIDVFLKKQKLEGQNKFWCKNCNKENDAIKSIEIYKTNKILIICLGRFKGYFKLNTFIEFPFNLKFDKLTDKSQGMKYDLYGVINHIGSNYSRGHCTSYCKDTKWRLFDDSNVRQVSQSEVLNKNAYVLFYRLRN